ncbi:MAG: ABC transporter permease [Bacteroidetes bacterium]|nr:ABC transporter permease [Bacteroidota bacterium]
MNKVWLIIQREFLNRVQKKSFLITTILVPLIFPAIIGGLVFFMVKEAESAKPDVVEVLDETGRFQFEDTRRFTIVNVSGPIEVAKKAYQMTKHFGLLHIPATDINNPTGITFYSRESQSIEKISELKRTINDKVKDFKMEQYNVDKETLKNIRSTDVGIAEISLSDSGEEKSSNTGILYGTGMALGILIYMFVLIYGIQIMQGVIDEKTSKVVEVIVSSVKPFQLMLGKIVGIASVGLVQFLIWIILITTVTSSVLGYFGMKMPQQQAMEQVTKNMDEETAQDVMKQAPATPQSPEFLNNLSQIPFVKVAFIFLFYFLGGYLLYGALFAAVGSAVDSIQESQQFQFPITLPLLIGYMGLFMFVLRDPHGTVSFWLSIIPFTSPVAMVGRIAYEVPLWQLLLSMALLILGFILTTWIAGRIYRVGILMTGTKVNYKVLVKWFLQKN